MSATSKAQAAFADPTRGAGSGNLGRDGADAVLFSSLKKESHTADKKLASLYRRLRATFNPGVIKEGLAAAVGGLDGSGILVFGFPHDKFSADEFKALKGFLAAGGSVLVLLGEGGETKAGTNINYFLEEYGIALNADTVVRTVVHPKYLHPKEVLIEDGVLNRAVLEKAAERSASFNAGASQGGLTPGLNPGLESGLESQPPRRKAKADDALRFVYPCGGTLTVQKPAVPILSTGNLAYPMNRPVAAVWAEGLTTGAARGGRLAVLGSADMLSDEWIDKEDNAQVLEFLLRWLRPAKAGASRPALNGLDAEDPEVTEPQQLPDTEALSERLRCCLQEGEELPADFTALFDTSAFQLSTDLLPDVSALYARLGLKAGPLALIAPQFDAPLPALQPAIFPPQFREPPAPGLDLYDLDEELANERLRLATLANKCAAGADADVTHFVQEGASILGLPVASSDGLLLEPKALLLQVFDAVVKWKNGS